MRVALRATAVAVVVSVGPAAASDAAAPIGHAGRWMTDSTGRVLILHGLNMVYKRPPYYPAAVGFGDDDAAFLAENGFNAVRLGVIYKAVEPQPGVFDRTYLDHIAETVDTLARHGIYSLLDFHQDLYNERFQGEGFPDWAVRDDGLPAAPQLGFPGNYLAMPALNHAFDHFWLNDPAPDGAGLQDHYATAWALLAQRFRDSPYVLGYDLFNEPWPGTQWSSCANPAGCPVFDGLLAAAETRSIVAIRKVDPGHLVFPEPNVLFNDGANTDLGNLGDSRAGLSFHDYCLAAGTVSGGGTTPDPPESQSCDTAEQLVLKNADAYAASTGSTLLLSEFGATNDYAQLQRVVGDADAYRDSWLEWHYCACADPTTSGAGATQALVIDPAKAPTGDNVNTTKLDVLARPYPQAVAGTPQSYAYDPATNVFTLSYKTAAPGGGGSTSGADTSVFVPRRHYRSGYIVSAQGARVVSAPNAQTLVLRTCAGAASVSVHVAPGMGGPHDGCGGRAPEPALGLPAGHGCRSRRHFPIHLRGPFGDPRLRSATVTLDGHPLRVVRRHGRLQADVDLRGLRVRSIAIRIRVTTTSGRHFTARRLYHLCVPGGRLHRH